MNRFLSLLVAALAGLTAGCASLPPPEGRTATSALADTAGTRLGRAAAADVAANPGKTGVHALPEPHDAFAARVLLAAAAEKSIDAQYYIWQGDQVGSLLFEALWQAAERGVRVRLLLDDLNTGGLDPTIATLDAHPNLEVRLYNPLVQRGLRLLNFMTDFERVNRRMHNKSFTVDNQVSIVGGRNIGNEYFGAGDGVLFADLDVIAVGAAVREVSREFDLCWNSASAYPAAAFAGAPGPDGAADLQGRFAATRADPESVAYLEAVRTTPLVRDLLAGQLALEWTLAQLVYDDPAKTLDTAARTDVLLFPELVRTIGRPEKTFDLISPYFVPAEDGTAGLVTLAGSGVKIRVLTNSLASAEANVVHAGYAKRRKDLLRAGIQLYEIKPTAAEGSHSGKAGFGSSASSALHAKTFAVDRDRIFVDSFNFDQRSARLNTEMGLVIDSPTLAQRLAKTFDTTVPTVAYEVRLEPDGGSLEWIEPTAAGETRYDTEPETSWFRRRSVDMLSILPIDWML
ncbi:MAG TPA: phospholipase D family protein [Burkholderiales bacterium]|nr:phospholipase D family protein [Burkholderiales bacterium]